MRITFLRRSAAIALTVSAALVAGSCSDGGDGSSASAPTSSANTAFGEGVSTGLVTTVAATAPEPATASSDPAPATTTASGPAVTTTPPTTQAPTTQAPTTQAATTTTTIDPLTT